MSYPLLLHGVADLVPGGSEAGRAERARALSWQQQVCGDLCRAAQDPEDPEADSRSVRGRGAARGVLLALPALCAANAVLLQQELFLEALGGTRLEDIIASI